MTDPNHTEEALANARRFIQQHRDTYTREAIVDQLRMGGYTAEVIDEAYRLEFAEPAPPVAPAADLRGRAAMILIAVFLLTWIVIGSGSAATTYGLGPWILGVALLLIGLASLIGIANSGRLRKGAEGALVTILAAPFVLLFIVAGICVATTW